MSIFDRIFSRPGANNTEILKLRESRDHWQQIAAVRLEMVGRLQQELSEEKRETERLRQLLELAEKSVPDEEAEAEIDAVETARREIDAELDLIRASSAPRMSDKRKKRRRVADLLKRRAELAGQTAAPQVFPDV